MFEIIKFFILGFKQSYRINTSNMRITGIILVIVLSISLCSCTRKPTTTDVQNVHTVQLHVKQKYTNIDKDIILPIKEMLLELFKAMDMKIVSEDESADAVLTINLKGRPRKITFTKPRRIFYKAAVVKGTASLAIKGFSSKKVGLYGEKHFYGTIVRFGGDPKIPLIFANKRAFIKMLIDLWGPPVLLSIWQTSYRGVLYEHTTELEEIIKDKDELAVVPVIMQALQSDSSSVRFAALEMLNEFAKTKRYNANKKTPKIIEMNSDMRDAVLKDLSQLIKALKDENKMVSLEALKILGRFKQDAKMAIPVLRELLNSEDDSIRHLSLVSFVDIAQPEESLPALIDALQSKSSLWYVLRTLGDMGSEAYEAVPLIIQILDHETSDESSVVEALEKITGEKFGYSAKKWQQWWETEINKKVQ